MDSDVKAKIKFRLALGCTVLVLSAGVIGWVYKISGIERELHTSEVVVSSVQAASVAADAHKNLFAAEEEQREVLLEQQREEQELAKKKAKKEGSHECQFWRLQEKQGKSPVAAKKVEQYCVLNREQSPTTL